MRRPAARLSGFSLFSSGLAASCLAASWGLSPGFAGADVGGFVALWLCGFACAECHAPSASAMSLRDCAAARLFRWLRRCSAPFAGMHHVRIWPRPRPASAPAPAPMAVQAPRALAEAQTARAMSNARGGGRRPRQRLNLRSGGDVYQPGLPQREKVAICGSTSFRWLR